MRQFIKSLLIIALTASAVASAQQYPARPVTFASAMAAGSTTDVLSREFAKLLSERLGQPIIVEIVAGGGGIVAAQKVTNSQPDGHTLLFVTNSLTSNQAMRIKPEFDIAKDLVAITPLFEGIFGLYVNPEVPARSLQEFIAYARANPGKLNYGSSGTGGILHLVAAEFASRSNIDVTHVPYKGAGEFMPATIAGQIQFHFVDAAYAQPFVDSGRVRLLALTSKQRLPNLPNVPTFEESGFPGFSPTFWFGLYAPRGTPPAVVNRINAETRAILTTPEAKARYAARGYQTLWMSPADTQKRVVDEIAQFNKTIDAARIERQ